jgi:hypothetical protein
MRSPIDLDQFCIAVTFPTKAAATRAFRAGLRVAEEHRCASLHSRARIRGRWHVVVIGDETPDGFVRALAGAYASGEPSSVGGFRADLVRHVGPWPAAASAAPEDRRSPPAR